MEESKYKTLRFLSGFLKILAYITLGVGLFFFIYATTLPENNDDVFLLFIKVGGITLILFIALLFQAQTIQLMIDIADNVENINNSITLLAHYTESKSHDFEKQMLENQQKIIELLTDLNTGNKKKVNSVIDPNDI